MKELKFRAAASGICRSGNRGVLIHFGRLVCHVLEFCL